MIPNDFAKGHDRGVMLRSAQYQWSQNDNKHIENVGCKSIRVDRKSNPSPIAAQIDMHSSINTVGQLMTTPIRQQESDAVSMLFSVCPVLSETYQQVSKCWSTLITMSIRCCEGLLNSLLLYLYIRPAAHAATQQRLVHIQSSTTADFATTADFVLLKFAFSFSQGMRLKSAHPSAASPPLSAATQHPWLSWK